MCIMGLGLKIEVNEASLRGADFWAGAGVGEFWTESEHRGCRGCRGYRPLQGLQGVQGVAGGAGGCTRVKAHSG